ncbi:MAG TPA: glycosyltransferase family 2 protein [Gemmatimonadales bacterium]|nr:glycosyltransferase family 2 protein [Gemmatimonadales bacterium]
MAAPADAAPAGRSTAIVIPAYQAAGTLGSVVAGARRALPGARIYVVDDGSSDGTGRVLGPLEPRLRLLVHARRRGKGAALATGMARALAEGAGTLVTLDADGQHPPEWIPALLEPLIAGRADLVLGARRRTGEMPLGRRFNNWLSAALATRIGGQPVPDAQTGFRAFTRAVAAAVCPAETCYDYEAAFLLEALERGFRVRSVIVPTIYDGAPSHFRPWRDSWLLARVFGRRARRILLGPR